MCTWLSLLTGLSSLGCANGSPGAPPAATSTSCCLPPHTELPSALRAARGPWDLPSEDPDAGESVLAARGACVLKFVPRSHCSQPEIFDSSYPSSCLAWLSHKTVQGGQAPPGLAGDPSQGGARGRRH